MSNFGVKFLVFFIFYAGILNAQLKVGKNNNALSPNSFFEVESTCGKIVSISKDSAYLGVGTNMPTTRLEIQNGTTPGAIKIVDGTQGLGKVLTSDANGIGTWNSINLGPISGKDLTNSNGIIVYGGNGATLEATSLRLDSAALSKMMLESPVKDSVLAVYNKNFITIKNISVTIPLMAVGDSGSVDLTIAGASVGDNVIANPRIHLPSGVSLAYSMVSVSNKVTLGFVGTGSHVLSNIPFDLKILK